MFGGLEIAKIASALSRFVPLPVRVRADCVGQVRVASLHTGEGETGRVEASQQPAGRM